MTVLVLIKKIKVECRNYPQNNLVYDVNTDCYVLTNYMNSLYKSTSNIFNTLIVSEPFITILEL